MDLSHYICYFIYLQAILDYSAEEDISSEQAENLEMK